MEKINPISAKKFTAIVAAAAIASVALVKGADAATITFEFNNVTFSDTGAISGSFTYESITGVYSNWNIFSGVGDDVITSFTYDTNNSSISNESSTTFDLINNDFTRQLELKFSADLGSITAVGQDISLTLSDQAFTTSSREIAVLFEQGTQTRGVTGGVITVSSFIPDPLPPQQTPSTPEPGMVVGFATLAGVGLLKRKKAQ